MKDIFSSPKNQAIIRSTPSMEYTERKLFQIVVNIAWLIISCVIAIGIWLMARHGFLVDEEHKHNMREISNIPIAVLVEPESAVTYKIEPKMVHIWVRGAKEIVDALSPDNVVIWVDARGLIGAMKVKLKPQVYLPAGLELLSLRPEIVELSIVKKQP